MNPGVKNAIIGNLACFAAYAIFGFNIICCKGIANDGHITPMALFCLRAFVATALFWLASVFVSPGERVERADYPKIFLASFLGLYLTQLAFLLSIPRITAIDTSIIGTLSPVMTLIISALAIHERITWKGVIGIALSLCGVFILIFNCVSLGGGAASTSLLGIVGMVFNALFFASYLGIFKPLIQKYSVVTFMKWMFLFSSLMAVPFAPAAFRASDLSALSPAIVRQLAYVVVVATFVAYFLIPIGQKRLRPVIVCMYTYVQPVVAMVIALAMGLDTLNALKIVAAVLVFTGVWIVQQYRN